MHVTTTLARGSFCTGSPRITGPDGFPRTTRNYHLTSALLTASITYIHVYCICPYNATYPMFDPNWTKASATTQLDTLGQLAPHTVPVYHPLSAPITRPCDRSLSLVTMTWSYIIAHSLSSILTRAICKLLLHRSGHPPPRSIIIPHRQSLATTIR